MYAKKKYGFTDTRRVDRNTVSCTWPEMGQHIMVIAVGAITGRTANNAASQEWPDMRCHINNRNQHQNADMQRGAMSCHRMVSTAAP
eukprot:6600891-Lingulodinium_polyedra.AAC.1